MELRQGKLYCGDASSASLSAPWTRNRWSLYSFRVMFGLRRPHAICLISPVTSDMLAECENLLSCMKSVLPVVLYEGSGYEHNLRMIIACSSEFVKWSRKGFPMPTPLFRPSCLVYIEYRRTNNITLKGSIEHCGVPDVFRSSASNGVCLLPVAYCGGGVGKMAAESGGATVQPILQLCGARLSLNFY